MRTSSLPSLHVKRTLRLCLYVPVLCCSAANVQASVFEVASDGTLLQLDTPKPEAPRETSPSALQHPRGSMPQHLRGYVVDASAKYAVSAELIDAIAYVESRYRQQAVSSAAAAGIMQLMPATARELGVDRHEASSNIKGGTAYLRQLLNRFDGDIVKTVAAYNAGPTAVDRAGGVPRFPETIAYVARVMARLSATAK